MSQEPKNYPKRVLPSFSTSPKRDMKEEIILTPEEDALLDKLAVLLVDMAEQELLQERGSNANS